MRYNNTESEVKRLRRNGIAEVKKLYTRERILKMGLEAFPFSNSDGYNPQEDDNKEDRDIYMRGMTDLLKKMKP